VAKEKYFPGMTEQTNMSEEVLSEKSHVRSSRPAVETMASWAGKLFNQYLELRGTSRDLLGYATLPYQF
jgi:hypothetical protein